MHNEETFSKKEYQYIKNAEKADQAIEKLTAKNLELTKIVESEKARAEKAETELKKEKDSHEETKKQCPSKEDFMLLHAGKLDSALFPILEKEAMEAIGASEEDLIELGISPILYEGLKLGELFETTNLIFEKPKGKLTEGKTFKITSKHSK
jgi:hypothetical protein